ncbi:MAG: carboxypeptidase-like regulatory domain-containing protein [Planctomycetota bacterium]|nr:carboxypeptidase-like regulatory domain-containing protein [Planctomycetota bacterium]
MEFSRTFRSAIALSAILAVMVNGPFASAAQTVAAASQVADVSLAGGGVLQGQIVTAQGAPATGVSVVVQHSGADVAQTVTDQKGVFKIAGLRGGVHQVLAAGQQSSVRLWSANSAPPVAQPAMLLVANSDDVVRGNHSGLGPGGGWGTVGAIVLVGALAYGIYEIADDDSGS